MPDNPLTDAEACLKNAADAREQAEQSQNQTSKEMYAAFERSWSILAESVNRNTRLEQLLDLSEDSFS